MSSCRASDVEFACDWGERLDAERYLESLLRGASAPARASAAAKRPATGRERVLLVPAARDPFAETESQDAEESKEEKSAPCPCFVHALARQGLDDAVFDLVAQFRIQQVHSQFAPALYEKTQRQSYAGAWLSWYADLAEAVNLTRFIYLPLETFERFGFGEVRALVERQNHRTPRDINGGCFVFVMALFQRPPPPHSAETRAAESYNKMFVSAHLVARCAPKMMQCKAASLCSLHERLSELLAQRAP